MSTTSSTTSTPTHLRTVSYHGLKPGPRLLVLGAVHGNEICGTRAITQILAELDSGKLAIERGSVTFVPVTNPLAYQRVQRLAGHGHVTLMGTEQAGGQRQPGRFARTRRTTQQQHTALRHVQDRKSTRLNSSHRL